MDEPTPLEVITASRDEAVTLANKTGRAELLKTLRKAEADLIARLNQTSGLKGPGKGSFTHSQLETTLRQVKDVIRTVQKEMQGILTSQGKKASDLATGNLVDYLKASNKKFKGLGESSLAIKEAGLLMQANAGVEASILRRLASSEPDNPEDPPKPGILKRYGMATLKHFEDTLAIGLITKKPWDEVKDGLISGSPFLQGAPASWAERIVRTETIGAYNRATFEASKEANEELGDLCRILAATFDDRTGWDSYQVHGQIRRLDEPFAWQGGLYNHPPNRPNDREIVVPHRISWPIPPYLAWKSDSEVNARYFQQRKKGSPGPRPLMTTIPLKMFGKEVSKKEE